MRQNEGRSWKVSFAIAMFLIAVLIFGSRIWFTGDPDDVITYLWKQIGFIPVNLLIVAFLLDGIMSKKEHEAILEKIDMIIGTFFTKIGNDLVSVVSEANTNKVQLADLKCIGEWDDKEYEEKLKALKGMEIEVDIDMDGPERREFLEKVYNILNDNQTFLLSLINNSNLLEKDDFSALLLALLHLDEELDKRGKLTDITDADFKHLVGDIQRVYSLLIYQWIYYLRYLNRFYPYMISLAIRTNPFDCDADVHVTE